MRFHRSLLVVAIVAVAIADAAADTRYTDHVKARVEIDTANGPSAVEFDSRRDGFRLDGLADGEARSIDDGSGRTISVSRSGESLALYVDGVRYDIGRTPSPAEPPPASQEPVPPPIDTAELRTVLLPDGLTIFGAERLEAKDRQRLRQAIVDTGLTTKVTFVDAEDAEANSMRWAERHTILHDADTSL